MTDDTQRKVAAAERRLTLWQRLVVLQRSFPALQLLMLIVVFAVGAFTLPGLASWPSIRLILTMAAIGGLVAAGQTMLIIMGGFDLSVPGFILVGAVSVCMLADKYGDMQRQVTQPSSTNCSYIAYIPNGTYYVNDTLIYSGPVRKVEGVQREYCIWLRFIGQNRNKTVIRLLDNCPLMTPHSLVS